MEQTIKDAIKEFMDKVIIDLNSKYTTTEKKRWYIFSDWRRGAAWGLKRGQQIMEKRSHNRESSTAVRPERGMAAGPVFHE